ncbi:OmpH family outer membrane protein [Candidatus Dependentiae bacterium]
MNRNKLFPLAILMASTFVIANKSVTVSDLGADVKAGYFNAAQVVGESKVGKEVYSQVEQKRQQFAADFKKRELDYTNKVKDLQAKQSTLSVAARQKAEEEIIKAKRDIENKAKEYEEDLKLAMQRGQESLFRDLSDAVYQCGRAEDKDVMIDVSSGRVYIINPEKVSSTKSIVASMDASYSKKTKVSKKTT